MINTVMKRFDLRAIIVAVVCFVLACGMVTGDVQNYIGFEDALNEMVFTFVLFLGTVGAIMNVKK